MGSGLLGNRTLGAPREVRTGCELGERGVLGSAPARRMAGGKSSHGIEIRRIPRDPKDRSAPPRARFSQGRDAPSRGSQAPPRQAPREEKRVEASCYGHSATEAAFGPNHHHAAFAEGSGGQAGPRSGKDAPAPRSEPDSRAKEEGSGRPSRAVLRHF